MLFRSKYIQHFDIAMFSKVFNLYKINSVESLLLSLTLFFFGGEGGREGYFVESMKQNFSPRLVEETPVKACGTLSCVEENQH